MQTLVHGCCSWGEDWVDSWTVHVGHREPPLPGAEAYILQKYWDNRIISKHTLWNCIPKY